MPDSIYDIAVALKLNDEASEGLLKVTEGMAKLVEHLAEAEVGLKGFGAALWAGAGVGVLLGMERLTASADKLVGSMVRMQIAGQDFGRTLEAARRVSDELKTMSTAEAAENIRRLYPLVGESIYPLAPQFMRAEELLGYYGHPGGLQPLLQAGRARGLRGQELLDFVNEQARTVQATQGMVSPEQLQMIFRRGGISSLGYDQDFLNNILPAAMMTGIGGRFGPAAALSQAERAFGGGTGRGGAGFQPRAWRAFLGERRPNEDLMRANPYEWAQTVARTISDKYGEQHMLEILSKLFTNPQAAMLMASFAMQGRAMLGADSPYERFRRDRAFAPGPESIELADRLDPERKLKILKKDWDEIVTSIGTATYGLRGEALDLVHKALTAIRDWVEKTDPKVIQNITIALGAFGFALAALAVSAGIAALLPGGAITLGLFVLATSITALALANPEKAAAAIKMLSDAISFLGPALALIPGIGPALQAAAAAGPLIRRSAGALGEHFMDMGKPNVAGIPWYFGMAPVPAPSLAPPSFGDRFAPFAPSAPGASPAPPMWLPQSFAPSGGRKEVHAQVVLQIDGKTLADATLPWYLEGTEFATGAPASNDAAGYNAAGGNYRAW